MWKVAVQLTNGKKITYDETELEDGGISIVGEVSQSDTFAIGTCVCREATISLVDKDANKNDFYDAEITVYQDEVQKGVFVCNKPVKNEEFIRMSCYDYMIYTDRAITDLISGNTLGSLAASVCDACNLTLGTPTFHGYDIKVTIPDISDMTYRELLGYIAQASCNFVRIDDKGRVVFEWYKDVSLPISGGYFDSAVPYYESGANLDGGYFDSGVPYYESGDNLDSGDFGEMQDYRTVYDYFNLEVGTDDVIITGVQIKNDDVMEQYGSDEYQVSIEDNPLTEGRELYFAQYIGERVTGLLFRPFKATLESDSSINAGETVIFTDIDGVAYKSFITKVTQNINSETIIECNAKSPVRQAIQRKTVETKILTKAKRNTTRQIKTYDQTVQDMAALISQGFGLYFTKLDDGAGGTKLYMHDKQTLEESSSIWTITAEGIMVSNDGTASWAIDKNGNALFNVITARGINADWITIGGQGNGDGRLVVRDNAGNIIIIIDRSGITMADGTSLINASGVCGDLTFTSGGTPYEIGYSGDTGGGIFTKQELYLQAVIPEKYIITAATLMLSTCATYWHTVWDISGSSVVYNSANGYPRNIKAYIGFGQAYKEASWSGEYQFKENGTYSQIVSGGFTAAGVNGSTTTSPKIITSGNIKDILKSGLNTIKFTPADYSGTTNLAYAQRTGTGTALLSVKGYTKN